MTNLPVTVLESVPEAALMGSSAGNNQSTEQSCEDLPLETGHAADGQGEHTTDSSMYPAHHSPMTIMTPSSLSRSDTIHTLP